MIGLQALPFADCMEPRQFHLNADERGAIGVAVFLQEIGGDEPDRVVVRVGDDGGQQARASRDVP